MFDGRQLMETSYGLAASLKIILLSTGKCHTGNWIIYIYIYTYLIFLFFSSIYFSLPLTFFYFFLFFFHLFPPSQLNFFFFFFFFALSEQKIFWEKKMCLFICVWVYVVFLLFKNPFIRQRKKVECNLFIWTATAMPMATGKKKNLLDSYPLTIKYIRPNQKASVVLIYSIFFFPFF